MFLVEIKIEDRIKDVMSAVFEIPVNEINDDSSPDTIESWESLKHMNLIIALEEEFNIQLTDDEILDMVNFSNIKNIIELRFS